MTCSYCDKTHSYVLSKVRNGTFIQVALCSDHAAKFESPFVSRMSEIHIKTDKLVLDGHDYNDIIKFSRENSNKSCVKCNLPVETFLATGVPTCDSCYDSFFSMVISILDNYSDIFGHPIDVDSNLKEENVSEIIELYKKKLEKSIKREDFVKAAEIRDSIKKIMDRLNHDSGTGRESTTENESSCPKDSSQGENIK